MGQGGIHQRTREDHDDLLRCQGVYVSTYGWVSYASQIENSDAQCSHLGSQFHRQEGEV